MAIAPNRRNTAVSRIALATGILCVACCAVPMIGVAVGSAAIAGLAVYSEKAAAAVAVLGITFLVFRRVTRRAAPSCDLDCGSRPAPADARHPEND